MSRPSRVPGLFGYLCACGCGEPLPDRVSHVPGIGRVRCRGRDRVWYSDACRKRWERAQAALDTRGAE